jgi:Protein of unknown function (DUF3307)
MGASIPESRIASFAAVSAALSAAHEAGDLWLQRDTDAQRKGNDSPEGQRACAIHVGTYVAAQAAALAATAAVTGLRIRPRRLTAGLLLSTVSHYIIDRRAPLKRLADAMQPRFGKGDFYRLGAPREGRDDNPGLGTGAYVLDQAAHAICNWGAALVMVGGSGD